MSDLATLTVFLPSLMVVVPSSLVLFHCCLLLQTHTHTHPLAETGPSSAKWGTQRTTQNCSFWLRRSWKTSSTDLRIFASNPDTNEGENVGEENTEEGAICLNRGWQH